MAKKQPKPEVPLTQTPTIRERLTSNLRYYLGRADEIERALSILGAHPEAEQVLDKIKSVV
jgi:hypothetical protein